MAPSQEEEPGGGGGEGELREQVKSEQANGARNEIFAPESHDPPVEAQIVGPSGSREMAGEAEEMKTKRNGKPITEKWRPAYAWLRGLNQQEVVKVGQIQDWLEAYPEVREKLRRNHTNEHIFNYIQKCHTRIIAEPKKKSAAARIHVMTEDQRMPVFLPSGRVKRCNNNMAPTEPNNVRAEPVLIRKYRKRRYGLVNDEASGSIGAWPSRSAFLAKGSALDKGKQIAEQGPGTDPLRCNTRFITEADLARRRFEMLSALRSELLDVLANLNEHPGEKFGPVGNRKGRPRGDPGGVIGWSFSEASSGVKNTSSSLQAVKDPAERIQANGSTLTGVSDRSPSVVDCLMDRERGGQSETNACRPRDVGRRGRRWTTFVSGWQTLETQFKGPVSWLQQKAYKGWCASWCAYTSSVALAPLGGVDQGVQKVLDLRLHPRGLPQLVCSCNAAPNELLIYNLVNGRARELAGHNCQIQAVEYALDGDRIISCGTNIMKIWDSASGACLYTMGPPVENEGTPGHKKKISAMAVHRLQSCLVATSGGDGESELLLWNVRTGDLVSDLNSDIRRRKSNLQSMDALQFCRQNLLICGSDSAGNQPAVVQIWDVEALKDLMTYPASDSYITCLNTDPQSSTIITGAGDGSVGLFDLRSGGAISRLPLGKGNEATSVAFSACGTYFHASSSANHTLVWDKRMMPMEPGLMATERPVTVAKSNLRSSRPLHCLSHGDPMPTTQNAGQLPGFVDEGDGGVNDARWCQSSPVLVTASGNGRNGVQLVTAVRSAIVIGHYISRVMVVQKFTRLQSEFKSTDLTGSPVVSVEHLTPDSLVLCCQCSDAKSLGIYSICSIAMWDVTLGKPCLRNISSHSRCINTITVSSDDQLIFSGGDDQKVVLYHNGEGKSTLGWRLTHPLSDETQQSAAARPEGLP